MPSGMCRAQSPMGWAPTGIGLCRSAPCARCLRACAAPNRPRGGRLQGLACVGAHPCARCLRACAAPNRPRGGRLQGLACVGAHPVRDAFGHVPRPIAHGVGAYNHGGCAADGNSASLGSTRQALTLVAAASSAAGKFRRSASTLAMRGSSAGLLRPCAAP